jgi:hypothetical protein
MMNDTFLMVDKASHEKMLKQLEAATSLINYLLYQTDRITPRSKWWEGDGQSKVEYCLDETLGNLVRRWQDLERSQAGEKNGNAR